MVCLARMGRLSSTIKFMNTNTTKKRKSSPNQENNNFVIFSLAQYSIIFIEKN
jgi:hypothetical protein